jgi:DNA-binding transcriptional ArsR family regulator
MPKYHGEKPPGDLSRILHALSDPTRRAIVERLFDSPASVTQLAEPLSMSMPAVLQHIGVLEEAGVVQTQKVGRVRSCQVDPSALRAAEAWFAARRTTWERRLDLLASELGDTTDGRQTPQTRKKRSKR